MHETTAARIVDVRDQHLLFAHLLSTLVGIVGSIPGLLLLLTASLARTDEPGWSHLLSGLGVFAGVLAVIVVIQASARARRRAAIARVPRLLAHGRRLPAKVVQSRRRSARQVQVSVHVDGPVAPFTQLIESYLDEAAFVGRAVEVVCDPANPADFVLVPSW